MFLLCGGTQVALSLLMILLFTTPVSPVSFQPQVLAPVGINPYGLAAGDFNSDAKVDLMTANYAGNTFSVLLGNGDGTFTPGNSYPVGSVQPYPISVAVSDLNGDVRIDAVVANYNEGNVSVLFGNGDGTFQTQSFYTVGANPACVVIADVNNDNRPDIIVANFGNNTAGVLLADSTSSGTFLAMVTYSVGMNPTAVAAADLNGDAKFDLAVVNQGSVSILWGNGDGTFQPQVTLPVATGGLALAIRDLNGDTFPDIAVACGNIDILLNNGGSTFQAAVTYTVGVQPESVAITQLDTTSYDIVVANNGDNNVSVLKGNGDGTFQPQVTFAVGLGPGAVVIADFNTDTNLDVAVANQDSNNVSVLLLIPPPTVTLATSTLPSTTTATTVPTTSTQSTTLAVSLVPTIPAATTSVAASTSPEVTTPIPITTTIESCPVSPPDPTWICKNGSYWLANGNITIPSTPELNLTFPLLVNGSLIISSANTTIVSVYNGQPILNVTGSPNFVPFLILALIFFFVPGSAVLQGTLVIIVNTSVEIPSRIVIGSIGDLQHTFDEVVIIMPNGCSQRSKVDYHASDSTLGVLIDVSNGCHRRKFRWWILAIVGGVLVLFALIGVCIYV